MFSLMVTRLNIGEVSKGEDLGSLEEILGLEGLGSPTLNTHPELPPLSNPPNPIPTAPEPLEPHLP